MGKLYVLKYDDVSNILEGQEENIMKIVSRAYVEHSAGKSSLPQSVFLRFPNNPSDRIIGLPAYLGGSTNAAGIKWISSYPNNINKSLERASALLILNNTENGHAEAVLESSIISAKRTAASAALAAKLIHYRSDEETIGIIGCGRINKEICKFLTYSFPTIKKIVIYDAVLERADIFKKENTGYNIEIANSIGEVMGKSRLISFATTASTPYLLENKGISPDTTILNISLRDIGSDIILAADNIVDDIEHVCRENTSVHIAEKRVKNREFIRGSIAEIIACKIPPRMDGKISVYSPFGLGVLDLALGCYVKEKGIEMGLGTMINDFLP